jgi:putative glycosyltransferase (TIGR04372 family)
LKAFNLLKTIAFLIEDGLTWIRFYYYFKKNTQSFLIWHRNWGFGHQITELAYARLCLKEIGARGILITCGKTNNQFLQDRMARDSFQILHFNLYSSYHAVCEKIERAEDIRQINIGFSPIDSIFYYCVRNNLMRQFYSMQESREKVVRLKISAYEASAIFNGEPFFSADQIAQSIAKLRRVGIDKEDWFVCIHIRSTKWSIHRNNSPESYISCIKYIQGIGGKVIVIGDENEFLSKLGVIFINSLYPKDEVLMMYVFAHQKLFICTNSGPMCISVLFDVPILMTNNNEWDYPCYRLKDSYLPKIVKDLEKDRLLTASEFVAYRSNGKLHNLNIDSRFVFLENTSEEMLVALKNKLNAIEGNNFDVQIPQTVFKEHFGLESTAQFSLASIDTSYFEKYKNIFLH